MSARGDMGRHVGALWLDDPTIERLLAGTLAPEDAPPPLAPVAELVRAARAPASAAENADEDTVVAAIAERVRWAASMPAPAEHVRRAPARGVLARVAVLTVALALSGTGVAAAAEGTLPSPVQRAVSTAASWVGVSVPKDPSSSTPAGLPDAPNPAGLAPVVRPAPQAATPASPCRTFRSASTVGTTRCAAAPAGPGGLAASATTTTAAPPPSTTVPAPRVVAPVPVAPTTVPATVPSTVPPIEHPPVSVVAGGPPVTNPTTTVPGTTVPPTTTPPTTEPPTTEPPTTTPPTTVPTATPPIADPPGTIPTSPPVDGPPVALVPGDPPPATSPPDPVTAVPDPPPTTAVVVPALPTPTVGDPKVTTGLAAGRGRLTRRVTTRPLVRRPVGVSARSSRPTATVLIARVVTRRRTTSR